MLINQNKFDLMSVEELAERLNISSGLAYQLCAEGTIHAMKIGRLWRISNLALEEYILAQSKITL